MVTIERFEGDSRTEDCLQIARELDGYFDETGVESMTAELPDQTTFVGIEDDEVVGFSTIEEHSRRVPKLAWIAVGDDRQREGIGTRLLDDGYEDRVASGVRLPAVKTPAETDDDERYDRTRALHESEEFLHADTIDPYPQWDPGNPCAIFAKPLSDADGRALRVVRSVIPVTPTAG